MLAGVLYNFLAPLPNTLIRDFRSSIASDSEAPGVHTGHALSILVVSGGLFVRPATYQGSEG